MLQEPPKDLANGFGCASPRLSGDGQSIAWACTQLLRLDNKVLFVSRPPGWQLTDTVSIPFPSGHLNYRVAIDYAGKTIAVGSAAVTFPIADDRNQLKPNNPIPEGGLFDGQVRFANNGKTLAVSEPDEPGNSSGIDGDRTAAGRIRTGAVWLY